MNRNNRGNIYYLYPNFIANKILHELLRLIIGGKVILLHAMEKFLKWIKMNRNNRENIFDCK